MRRQKARELLDFNGETIDISSMRTQRYFMYEYAGDPASTKTKFLTAAELKEIFKNQILHGDDAEISILYSDFYDLDTGEFFQCFDCDITVKLPTV
jgi:hypothetical protein